MAGKVIRDGLEWRLMNSLSTTRVPAIFDCHAHLYTPSIINSVSRRDGLASALCLNMEGALDRTNISALKEEAAASGIHGCLLLPVAPVTGIHAANDLFASTVAGDESLFTAGTLHPALPDIETELEWLSQAGIRAIKLSSFSQGFSLDAEPTLQMFEKIRRHNISGKPGFFVLLDTFYRADAYFGTLQEYLTTPERLSRLAEDFPEIPFVGAHMGGLTAPYPEINKYLLPRDNLYLDTSNASRTLPRQEFLHLLHRHGPNRVLFGTDWPWFRQADEIAFISELLEDARFSHREASQIFNGNISRLLGLSLGA